MSVITFVCAGLGLRLGWIVWLSRLIMERTGGENFMFLSPIAMCGLTRNSPYTTGSGGGRV